MSNDWETYYANRASNLGPRDFLQQVGHTVAGEPIPDSHVSLLLDQIRSSLALSSRDSLLDLCCGNGLFTIRLAEIAKSVVGVDISAPLIEVAKDAHSATNVEYLHMDARKLSELATMNYGPFSKIVMFAAIQHFSRQEFEAVLAQILACAADDCTVLIGFVPAQELKWKFYNTIKRKTVYLLRTISGRDTFGTWWRKKDFEEICSLYGLQCEIAPIAAGLHASSYRINALLRRST